MNVRTLRDPNPYLVGAQGRHRLAPIYLSSLMAGRRQQALFNQVERFCFFVGYPRSGHTLIGSLVDAHRDVVIANELDVLRYLRLGFTRNQLYALLLKNDRNFTDGGRMWTGSDYNVPGGWQGTFRTLRVIGDKKGGVSTLHLRDRPELLDRLRRTVRVPLLVVHVTRSPFDNISTMKYRRGLAHRHESLETVVDDYFRMCDTVATVRQRLSRDELLDVRYEDFVAEPRSSLQALCAFLDVEPDEQYLAAASAVVGSKPSRSRDKVDWPPAVVMDIEERISRYSFLAGYAFDS